MRANHMLASLIESFLKANPEKARDQAELDEMDRECKFTAAELRGTSPIRAGRGHSGYDDEDEDEDDYTDDEGPAPAFMGGFFRPPVLMHHALGVGMMGMPPLVRCRHCTTATADGYTCPGAGASHLRCTMCSAPFPDRHPQPQPVKCTWKALSRAPIFLLYFG